MFVDYESKIAEYLNDLGIKTFKEPFSGLEPDILILKKEERKIIIIEVKNRPIDSRAVSQACAYARRLKPIFEEMGFSVEVWLIGRSCTEYQKKKLEKCNVEFMSYDDVFINNKIIKKLKFV